VLRWKRKCEEFGWELLFEYPEDINTWRGGDKTDGALFYSASSGKFDLIPAK